MPSRPPADSHRLLTTDLLPPRPDLLRVGSRRWFLQTGLAGLAGLTLPDVLRAREAHPVAAREPRAVILFWLSGGPSQIDTWDPKPDAPPEIRGPYQSIPTRVPGVRVCEHLPLQARILDRLTLLRAVDCSASDHTPITMQAGNALARRNNDGKDVPYPSMGSVAARLRGSNAPGMPAFVGLANSWRADVWGAGDLGHAYEPVNGLDLPGRLSLPAGVTLSQLHDRAGLRRQFDGLQRGIDRSGGLAEMDRHAQAALDIVTSARVRQAFDLDREPAPLRDFYGRCSVGEKALLARRLVEAGSTFVLVSGAWGYFDHHGDDVPPWGGILRGLTPILPTIDRALYALVTDLETRGLLDSTLVLMLGEFGRSPAMTPGAGRNHWTHVMSMVMAGGGLRHGGVLGATDGKGGEIRQRRVSPSDLAATVFQHLGIPQDATWVNAQGRPMPVVAEGGRAIAELS